MLEGALWRSHPGEEGAAAAVGVPWGAGGGEGSDGLATAEGFGAEQDAMTNMTKEIMKAS